MMMAYIDGKNTMLLTITKKTISTGTLDSNAVSASNEKSSSYAFIITFFGKNVLGNISLA